MAYPHDYQTFLQFTPEDIQAMADELLARPLNAESIDGWLRDWAQVGTLFQESLARLEIAISVNTGDKIAAQQAQTFRESIWPIGHRMHAPMEARLVEHEALLPPVLLPIAERIKRKAAGHQSDVLVGLANQEYELMNAYGALMGAQSIEWQGETLSDRQARGLLNDPDAGVREQVWRKIMARRAEDYDAVAELWVKLLDLRTQIAQANGFENYIDYRWQELERTDYTPGDALVLHQALAETWANLYQALLANKQRLLGLAALPSWDREAPTEGPPLQPFTTSEDLIAKTSRVFHRLSPEFGAEFDRLVAMNLINIVVGGTSAPVGGFARAVGTSGVYVMLNSQGNRIDVENLLHEVGHAFALIESCKLPYHLQWGFGTDFTETPSSAMEMLSMPFWDEFYQGQDLAQARREYFTEWLWRSLEEVVIEAFQFWAYSHPDEARIPANCDAKWLALHQRYLPGVDYSQESALIGHGWQRVISLFYSPLFAMEYVYGRIAGLNLLQTAERDPEAAVAQYRRSLGLGAVSPAENFAALGTPFFISADQVANAAVLVAKYLAT